MQGGVQSKQDNTQTSTKKRQTVPPVVTTNKHPASFQHHQARLAVLTSPDLLAEIASSPLPRCFAITPTPGHPSWQTRQNVGVAKVTWLLCAQKTTSHINKPAKPGYSIQKQCGSAPLYANDRPRPTRKPSAAQIRRVSSEKTVRHFVKACAGEKEGRLRSCKK